MVAHDFLLPRRQLRHQELSLLVFLRVYARRPSFHLEVHVAADRGVLVSVVGQRLFEADRGVQELCSRWDSRVILFQRILDVRRVVARVLSRQSLRFPLRSVRPSALSVFVQIVCHQYLRRHDNHLQQLVPVLEVEEPDFAQAGAPPVDLV